MGVQYIADLTMFRAALSCISLLVILALDGVSSRSQRRLPVDDSVLKSFAQGPSEMFISFDERVRPMEKSEHQAVVYRPEKRGAIIDGKLIPYSKLENRK